MNSREIIKKDGYKRKDLNEENERILNCCEYIVEQIDTYFEYIKDDFDKKRTLDKIDYEITKETLEGLKEYYKSVLADLQIELIESQED